MIGAWAILLLAAYPVVGRAGLGTLLTAAFFVQVAPSLWTAYRTARPTGISSGTWLLILGELSCWLVFGLYRSDPRLITLGVTGVVASTLILARIHRTGRRPRTSRRPRLLSPDVRMQHRDRAAAEVKSSRIHAEQPAQVQAGADQR